MNKCAFVIPLHPKHYNYGCYIYNYLINKNVDLYFVFTDNDDLSIFLSIINNKPLKYLILSQFANIELVKKTNSFPSIKKLFALLALYEYYDYISCIDAEIRFINNDIDYYNMMKNIVDSKIICAGILSEHAGEKCIVRDSLTQLIDNKYHDNLREISHNYRLYTWWSNVPVYDCKIANHFLQWINFNNYSLDRFVWNIFDDMTYNYYCVLIHNYQLKIIPECYHSLEFSNSPLVEYTNDNLCKLYWVNNNAYNQNKKYYDNNFAIVFHLDRWNSISPILQNNEYI